MKRFILAVAAIFLSSGAAEATHGVYNIDLTASPVVINRTLGVVNGRVSALVGAPVNSVFDRGSEGIPFVVSWPLLPSTDEVRIQYGRKVLAEATHRAVERLKSPSATELQIKYRHFWSAIGELLLAMGIVAFLVGIEGGVRRR